MNATPDQATPTPAIDLEALAKEFAVLLAESNLPEETQTTLIAALPHLQPEEIMALLEQLEAQYTTQQTTHFDVELMEKFDEVAADFTKRQAVRDEQLLKELEVIEKSLE